MNFDLLLAELGGFNRYQIFQFLLLTLLYMVPAMQNFSSIFTAAAPKMFCRSAAGQATNVTYTCSTSQGDGSSAVNNSTNFSTTTDAIKTSTTQSGCRSMVFDRTVFQSTIVTKYDLVCSYGYLSSLSVTLYMAGFLVGSFLFGVLSDRFGRVKCILVCGIITFGMGIVSPFSPTFAMYSICRFFVGLGAAGLVSVTFTMSTENIPTANRSFIGMLINYGWTSGILILCILAYFIRSHVYLEIAIALPASMALVIYLTLQESPRWLFVTGKFKQTEKACRMIAKFNKIDETKLDLTRMIKIEGDKVAVSPTSSITEISEPGLVEILRSPGLRKVALIIWFQFTICSLVYYGVSLGVGDLSGNVFLNTAIAAVLEYPTSLAGAFLTKRFGRVRILAICYAISGIACLTTAGTFGRDNLKYLMITTSMIGRTFVLLAFIVQFLYTAEVAPTSVRSLFVGTGSTWARVGSMIAPQIGLLRDVWLPMPFLVYGTLPMVALALAFLLPETNGLCSPETIEEGEIFIKSRNERPDQASSSVAAATPLQDVV